MTSTPSPDAVTGDTSGTQAVEAPAIATRRRVGRAWREIRRGAAAGRIKDLFYGMGEEGLDMALADALSVLGQNGSMRMGELAEALRITPASTTRAVGCLVDRGFVERVRAESDQRSIEVSLTPAGRDRYEVITGRVQVGLTQILSEFSDDEQLLLAEMLERFTQAVDHYVDSQDHAGDEA